MTSPLDTEYWELSCTIRFKKKPACDPTYECCHWCGGGGTTGGGLASNSDVEDCPSCNGTGSVAVYKDVPEAPPIPAELTEALRATYKEYMKGLK